MLTFQDQYTMFQRMAQDTDSTVLIFGKQNINLGMHVLETELDSFYMEDTRTGTTSSSTDIVQLPENLIRLKKFYVTKSSVQYVGDEVYDENLWRAYQARAVNVKSDQLTKIFRRRDTLELYPAPSSANTWTAIYEAIQKDLSFDDYATGTVSIAAAGTTVTGVGTTFTAAMVGRYIKFSTDTQWYEIATFTSTTSIALKKAYQGTVLSGASYTIGEVMRLPEPTQHIPVYFALWQYFESYKRNEKFALLYKNQYEQYMQWAKTTYGKRYASQYIPSQRGARVNPLRNPNYYPETIT
jgi:hypothetical protein